MTDPALHPDSTGASVDLAAVRARLATARQSLAAGWLPSPHAEIQTLRRRAQALAQEPPPRPAQDALLHLLEFLLGTEHYAVELCHVREVYALKSVTSLPGTPAFVLGVTNVRGRLISVLDLRRLLHLAPQASSSTAKAVVLQREGMEFALCADDVAGVRTLQAAEVRASVATLTGARARYLLGITSNALTVLDGAKLLTDTALVVT